MSSKAMDEVNKPLGQCRYVVLPDSSLTELNNYNFYSMKEGFFMFGKKKKVKGNFISTCDARLIVEMLCAY